MEEIKSVRVRRKEPILESNLGTSDIKVILQEDVSKWSLIGISGSRKVWDNLTYNKTGRYANFSNNDLINDFIKINSKREGFEYEIIQDPWLEKPPIIRNFGYDPYYLNNGASIIISWLDNSNKIGGRSWSDESGSELKFNKITGDSKENISKRVNIFSSDSYNGDNQIMILTQEGIKSNGEYLEFSGDVLDSYIIKRVIYFWKKNIPNYNLDVCEYDYISCNLIEYKDPLDEVEESLPEEENKLASEDPISDDKINLVFDIDKSVQIKVRNDISFKLFIGEKPKDPLLDGFDFGDEESDLSLLDDEFLEEESVIVNGEKIILFNNSELNRDEGDLEDNGEVETAGDSVLTPSGPVGTSIILSDVLKSVQNSNVLLKQSLGNGKFRNINNDIVSPKGDRVNGVDIVKNMNAFIKDVLDPFSKFLKDKYPSLYKSWYITSATRGYIPSGGSLTSQHLKGQAIDSQILGSRAKNPGDNIRLLNAILEWYKINPVGYSQILFETRGQSCWIHWSYYRGNKRLHFARFDNDKTKRGVKANTSGKYVLPPLSEGLLGF